MTFGLRRGAAAPAVALVIFVAALAVATGGARAGSAGAGPPGGSYTAAQASAGATLWAAKCAQCHGANLEGGAGPALTGANLRTLSKNTKLTVGDLFTFMSQQMPLNDPASLKQSDYSAIMAFILKKNGYPAGAVPLKYAAAMDSKMALTSKN
jgi:mono/diheme cytochrome c family protein